MTNQMITRLPRAAAEDFGSQGGDPRRMVDGVDIDLSTCVNFYGPPEAVQEALGTIRLADLQIHPYAASERMEQLYARCTGVPASQFIAGRGTTEFIWALSRRVPQSGVAVPLPAYTDYLKAFPGRGFARYAGEQCPSIEQLDAALERHSLAIISNPHNPTGIALDPGALIDVAERHPLATLVVDESYVDFVSEPERTTVIGADVENLVVLRSPSKFYGIAATRVGVAWCANRDRLSDLLGRRETWPISGVDVTVAEAAMASEEWADRSRLLLGRDARWLAEELRHLPGTLIERDVDVHYRCVFTEEASELASVFAAHGVGVRVLSRAHGVYPDALRILAPQPRQQHAVAAVIGRSLASDGVSSAPALAIRFAIAAMVLAVVLAVRRTGPAPPPRTALKILALGAIGYAGQSTLFYLSLERGTAATCILLFYAYPALVILVAWALGQGRPARGTVVAVVLSAAGTAIVATSSGPLEISSVGIALALGSACVFAFYVLAGTALGSGQNAMTTAAWVAAGAALASAGRGALEHSLAAPAGQWPLLIAYGVMTAAAFSLMFAALARLGAGRAAVVMTLEAFFTVALAALFLGEAVTLGQAIGGAGILAGTVIISRARAGTRSIPARLHPRPPGQVAFVRQRRGGANDDQAVRAL